MPITIAFHTPDINVRGTCNALYYYAHYNEKLLGNKSIIIVPQSSIIQNKNDIIAIEHFKKRFQVFFYIDTENFESILDYHNIHTTYYIKYGKNDMTLPKNVRNVIHCVFDMSEPHGDVYAGVSEQVAEKFGQKLYVPHMIGLNPSLTPEINLRKELNIPDDAIVFGRHGGQDTFDIQFVKQTIGRVVRETNNVFFIFVNTPIFDGHPKISYLDKFISDEDKNKFICSCDAMIHAQNMGETFGLSIGEFSVNNKPIITYGGMVWNDAYRKILKDDALYYYTDMQLYEILIKFDKSKYVGKDLNYYKEYTPDKVMKIFSDVFL